MLRTFAARGREVAAPTWGVAYVCRPRAGNVRVGAGVAEWRAGLGMRVAGGGLVSSTVVLVVGGDTPRSAWTLLQQRPRRGACVRVGRERPGRPGASGSAGSVRVGRGVPVGEMPRRCCRPWAGSGGADLGCCVRLPPMGGRWRCRPGRMRTVAAHGREVAAPTWADAYGSRPRAGDGIGRTPVGAGEHLPLRVNSSCGRAVYGECAPLTPGELSCLRVDPRLDGGPPDLRRARPARRVSSWQWPGPIRGAHPA